MGLERECRVVLDGQTSEGKAHCGDGLLEFRGAFRVRWKWAELTAVSVEDEVLIASHESSVARFELGAAAPKWLHIIQNPKTWAQKLGLKPDDRYRIIGQIDDIAQDLAKSFGSPSEPANIQFIHLRSIDDLASLPHPAADLSIWVVYEKGGKTIREADIRSHARGLGWIDVKVASVNAQLTSLKFVLRK
jgi:hypothetical protein